jgi:hypothetical protein
MSRSLLVLLFLQYLVPARATTASTDLPFGRKRKLAALKTAEQKKPEVLVQQSIDPEPVEDEKSEESSSPAVPTVVDAGSDGMPELPPVSKMLSGASDTLKSVSSQASGLQARVVQAQMQSETKMARQKGAFEEKLKVQEEGNKKVIEANNKIKAEIARLEKSNTALKKEARDIEKNNKVMRSQLQTLESRMGVAQDFTVKSLTETDDSKSALLEVLRKGRRDAFVEKSSKSKGKDDDDEDDDSSESSDDEDTDDDDEDDTRGTSLLALSRKSRRADPPEVIAAEGEADAMAPAGPVLPGPSIETASAAPTNPSDILGDLAKEVAHLALQEKDSEKKLKDIFVRDYRAGIKRNKVLLAQQKSLIATRTNLLNVEKELKNAEAHVNGVGDQLRSRLHGLGQFLQKLAHFAITPEHDMSKMGLELPKAVTVKEAKTESKA